MVDSIDRTRSREAFPLTVTAHIRHIYSSVSSVEYRINLARITLQIYSLFTNNFSSNEISIRYSRINLGDEFICYSLIIILNKICPTLAAARQVRTAHGQMVGTVLPDVSPPLNKRSCIMFWQPWVEVCLCSAIHTSQEGNTYAWSWGEGKARGRKPTNLASWHQCPITASLLLHTA